MLLRGGTAEEEERESGRERQIMMLWRLDSGARNRRRRRRLHFLAEFSAYGGWERAAVESATPDVKFVQ